MSKALSTMTVGRSEPQYRQINRQLRDLISSGALKAGERLPSTLELCRLWGAKPCTVQAAMSPLVKEGLLQRLPRIGTTVAVRKANVFQQVAIYYTQDVFREEGSVFLRSLHGALEKQLHSLGVVLDTWIDPRGRAQGKTVWTDLMVAAKARRFDALIIPDFGSAQAAWMARLPVPVACMATTPGPNVVTVDYASVFALGLQSLKGQGCRTVGVISAFGPHDGASSVGQVGLESFRRTADRLGLAFRDEWLMAPRQVLRSQAAFQQFGYDAVHALWRQKERPEGLIVGDDVMLAGVFSALLELGIRTPVDLKLVGYKNSAIPVFSPMPVTFVEVSTEAIAAALVEQIQKQLKGVPVTHRMIRPALVEGALRPVARNIIRKKSSVIRKP
jgi:DNA-binding transcriptional regulator YhcF (GntR family)